MLFGGVGAFVSLKLCPLRLGKRQHIFFAVCLHDGFGDKSPVPGIVATAQMIGNSWSALVEIGCNSFQVAPCIGQ